MLKSPRNLNEIIIGLDSFYHSLGLLSTNVTIPFNILKVVGKLSHALLKGEEYDALDMASLRATIRIILSGEIFLYVRDLQKTAAEWSMLAEYEMTRGMDGKNPRWTSGETMRW
jgi:hypothetical protein